MRRGRKKAHHGSPAAFTVQPQAANELWSATGDALEVHISE